MKTLRFHPAAAVAALLSTAALVFAAIPAVEARRNPHAADVWKLPAGEPAWPAGEESAPVRKNCSLCHSPDYISTQPRLGRKAWEASVEKMRAKYGAPIPTNEVPAIVSYLVKHHGKE